MSKDLILITLDFETYYSKKEKYSLASRGMTYEKYIRNDKFEIIGLAVKINDRATEWLAPHEIEDWIKHIEVAYGWDNVRVVAHNGRFDMAIMGWLYGVYPKQIADTMLMSRACQLWDGHSLDNVTQRLRDKYHWGMIQYENGEAWCGTLQHEEDFYHSADKGTEVHDADGKHLMDFTDEEYDAYAEYAKKDVDLTWSAYKWFMDERKFPEKEIDVMTATIETFTFPAVELHKPVLLEVEKTVNGKRQALLDKVGASVEDLRSDAKFAELLRELGVEPPTKRNAKGEVKYAFAKKDLQFLKLLEHEDRAVVELVEARLGNKSSQAVTRVQSLLEMADRGLMPMPLEYYAAHTGRWGGCFSGFTPILVKADGVVMWKAIADVHKDDLVFDGEDFVTHSGVEYRGLQKVYVYDGVAATFDHPVFLRNGRTVPFSEYPSHEQDLWVEQYDGEVLTKVWGEYTEYYVEQAKWYMALLSRAEVESYDFVSTFDIVNCGKNNRFMVGAGSGGLIVHNSDAVNVQNFNRNQLVDKSTPSGTKVFYNDQADAVVEVLDGGKVHLARAGVVENDEERLHVMGLRDALKAPKGKKLVVLDWSQIELRFNSWLWGESWILDSLVAGKDVYKVTAVKTYGVPYEEVTKSQRFVGKAQQLGLGYGAGINGLRVVMGKRSEEFTDEELQGFVNSYRHASQNIKRGWGKCKSILDAMVQGVDVELNDANGLFFTNGNKVMRPNGMALTYRNVHHRPGDMGNELWFWGKNKQTKKPDWEKTFGGKVTENICQAACRDIAAEKVVTLRERLFGRGFSRDDAHIVMTVHDEIIVCCKEELAEEVYDIMRDVMTHSVGWYATLPLEVDGSIAQRYGCAK